jgi:hypothetical protein
MIEFVKKKLGIILGGRPMRKVGYALTDCVSGKIVYYYEDLFGRTWLAEGPISLFRVRVELEEIENFD